MTTIGQQLVALANTIGVNSKKKIELKKELDIIEKDMNTNSVDDPSLAELLSNNKQLLEHVKEQKIFPGRKEGFKGNNPQQRQTSPRTIGAVQQSDILSEDPEATKNGLSLYLARLSQVFINQEIKKTPMNDKLLAIIQDDELVKLMEMLTVMPSRNRDNAFDLSIQLVLAVICLGILLFSITRKNLLQSKSEHSNA